MITILADQPGWVKAFFTAFFLLIFFGLKSLFSKKKKDE